MKKLNFLLLVLFTEDETYSNIRVICKRDGQLYQINEVPEGCYLIATVNSEIISKSTNLGNWDFREALLQMDDASSDKPDKLMDIFSSFKGQGDLLFKVRKIKIIPS